MTDLTNYPLIEKNLHLKSPRVIFPDRYSWTLLSLKPTLIELESFIRAGNKVHVEFTDGAKDGAVGILELDHNFLNTYYKDDKYGFQIRDLYNTVINITWPDRKNTDKWKTHNEPRFRFNFTAEPVWAFKAKEKEEEKPKEIFDHFGIKLEVGQVCIFLQSIYGGKKLRFGKIARITPKGSVFVNPIKTHDSQWSTDECMVSNTADPDSFVVFDDDLKTKLLMKALKR
jgi:hypothetical protein